MDKLINNNKIRTPRSITILLVVFTFSFSGCFDNKQGGNVTPQSNPGPQSPVNFQAVSDVVSTGLNTPVNINILANDSGFSNINVSLLTTPTLPSRGNVIINPDLTITYSPASGFSGTDTFSYTVSSNTGSTSSANVTVSVNCSPGCLKKVIVSWDQNPDPAVTTYNVYHGTKSGVYTDRYQVQSATSITVMLPSGQHVVAVSSVDSNGIESPFSTEQAFTVP